jgi:hypothetical protein
MYKPITAFAVVLFLPCSFVIGQDARAPEPDTLNTVYYLDSAHHALTDLEKQTSTQGGGGLKNPFGRAKQIAKLKGDKSSVRFRSDQTIEFVISLTNNTDPTMLVLYPFTPKKDSREAVIGTAGGIGDQGFAFVRPIPLKISRYGQASYKIVPETTLKPGEYGFTAATMPIDFRCFGIDPAN